MLMFQRNCRCCSKNSRWSSIAIEAESSIAPLSHDVVSSWEVGMVERLNPAVLTASLSAEGAAAGCRCGDCSGTSADHVAEHVGSGGGSAERMAGNSLGSWRGSLEVWMAQKGSEFQWISWLRDTVASATGSMRLQMWSQLFGNLWRHFSCQDSRCSTYVRCRQAQLPQLLSLGSSAARASPDILDAAVLAAARARVRLQEPYLCRRNIWVFSGQHAKCHFGGSKSNVLVLTDYNYHHG